MGSVEDYLSYAFIQIWNPDSSECRSHLQKIDDKNLSNKDEIAKRLIQIFFREKCREICLGLLNNCTHYSLILPPTSGPDSDSEAAFVQFFDPKEGLKNFIYYTKSTTVSVSIDLKSTELSSKMIGYCGDFVDISLKPDWKNPEFDKYSAHFEKNENVLPHKDNVRATILNVCASYIKPVNVISAIKHVGEIFLTQKPFEPFVQVVAGLYRDALKSPNHILDTDYAFFIKSNFDNVRNLLLNSKFITYEIGEMFNNRESEFYLSFLMCISDLIEDELNFKENCAILYYQRLQKLVTYFEVLKSDIIVPEKCLELSKEVWDTDVMLTVTYTYKRISVYLEHVLEQFGSNFKHFDWVLLENKAIDLKIVHECYHVISSKTCGTECPQVITEAVKINKFLERSSNVKTRNKYTLDQFWVKIFQDLELNKIVCPYIENMVSYVLSLPCMVQINPMDEYSCMKNLLKTRYSFDDFVENQKNIFVTEWKYIEEAIREMK